MTPNISQLHNLREKFKTAFNEVISRIATAGSHPLDTEKQRLRKAVLIFLTIIYCILGILWGVTYLAWNHFYPACIPFGYVVLSGANFYYFLNTKKYRLFRFGQLVLILFLPFFLQWSLGGFAASGAVMIWAILSPIGALMFTSPKRAVPWFGSFILLMIVSGLIEGKLEPFRTLLPLNVIISFVMNLSGVSAIVFFLLKYFVSERERTITALDEAHRRVRQSLSLAMEVQQNLLPAENPNIDGLDIAGRSIYCDETGGDYYDFLKPYGSVDGEIGVVVGDVSEHGIPSALLMATARAIIRQRISSPGSLSEIASDVNRELARDVEDSGRFMTLFYAILDPKSRSIRWTSAGHEPAILYDPAADNFSELKEARGFPLGIMEDAEFEEAKRDIEPGQIIVSATDGIIESRNPGGDMFGKQRLKDAIRKNSSGSAEAILDKILNTLNRFKSGTQSEDDITLVVIKVE